MLNKFNINGFEKSNYEHNKNSKKINKFNHYNGLLCIINKKLLHESQICCSHCYKSYY